VERRRLLLLHVARTNLVHTVTYKRRRAYYSNTPAPPNKTKVTNRQVARRLTNLHKRYIRLVKKISTGQVRNTILNETYAEFFKTKQKLEPQQESTHHACVNYGRGDR